MNGNTALAVIVCAYFVFVGVIELMDDKPEREAAIGTECVRAGGEWIFSWGQYECVHKEQH